MKVPREAVLLAALLVVGLAMSLVSPHFLKGANLLELTRHLAETGMIACGMTFVIMTAGIDLSVGSLLGLSGIVLGYAWHAWGAGIAVPLAFAVGLGGGLLNGGLITACRLPPLVVTLATMALFRGLAMVISRARPVSDFPAWFAVLGQGRIGPVPMQLVVWVILVVAADLLIRRTVVGRYATAVGANEHAARFAAVPVRAVKIGVYAATGLLSAVAAMVFASRVSTAKADAGLGLELEVIAAVVLGGTQITGGRGTALGTFIAVLILGFVRNGLSLAGVPAVWQVMLSGTILIAAGIGNERLGERIAAR
jgi:rhamnose transport system permease protein